MAKRRENLTRADSHSNETFRITIDERAREISDDAKPRRDHLRDIPSRTTRKAQRQSRPAALLQLLGEHGRRIYALGLNDRFDLSYGKPRFAARPHPSHHNAEHIASQATAITRLEPTSLFTILSRLMQHHQNVCSNIYEYTQAERDFLLRTGYTTTDVCEWAACIETSKSKMAARIFEPGRTAPPLFLLNIFLRRKVVRASALGAAMRYLERWTQTNQISWSVLKICVIRMLRHARQVWPESIPWIASFFTRHAPRGHGYVSDNRMTWPKTLSDVTHFCNTFLSLLSLPTNLHPILYATNQENAQFHVLHYMASCSPPIIVSRLGFRALTRNQLAHAKTMQEKDWAELKGPSWPPWKEARTSMDSDKDYEYGASRASQIIHRMYDAGYAGRAWEDVAQVYAGWDVDASPTIQTRTLLPLFTSQYEDEKTLQSMLWAGRIRTTRTRREAWAGFLSHEATSGTVSAQSYLAMFEKLYYPEARRATQRDFNLSTDGELDHLRTDLLPGDMKEVLPDPVSPLHYVYLSEPVPSYRELFRRMQAKNVHPSGRLLTFLLETCPDFNIGISALDMTKDDYGGAIGQLVACQHDRSSSVPTLPEHLFTAFMKFLCRFGRYNGLVTTTPAFKSMHQHANSFHSDTPYLYEYANSLLLHYRPRHRPAWMAFASKMVQSKSSRLAGNVTRYRILCELIDSMEEIDLDIDDQMFSLLCTATRYAVQDVNDDAMAMHNSALLVQNGARRLRTIFNDLTSSTEEGRGSILQEEHEQVIPPHIPGPAELHAYVRALSALRDYEGLHSFSSWLVRHKMDVTNRASARHSGGKLLFRTLVALRLAVEGEKAGQGAPEEIAQFIRIQVDNVEEWGGWPDREYVDMYKKGFLKTSVPRVAGR